MKNNGWFRLVDSTPDSVEIDIYGDIGDPAWWEAGEGTSTSAKQFLDAVHDARGKAIDLRVNSGGGSVFDAFAMMTALAEHDGKVTAHVDGLAASAASFLLAAADEVRVASNAFVMIHSASSVAVGNAEDMRRQADWLDMVDAQLAGIYAKRSSTRTEDEFLQAMRDTTWFDADAAVEWGLADEVDEVVKAAAHVTTSDRATLASFSSAAAGAAALIGANAPVGEADTHATDHGGGGQEPAAAAQERHATVLGGKVYEL